MVAMATDHVVNPQIWPQTNLQCEYVSEGVTFQQLDLKLENWKLFLQKI
jgi:hypothetical protein